MMDRIVGALEETQKMSDMPDRIWAHKKSRIRPVDRRWYDYPESESIPYLRSTPAREHAEEYKAENKELRRMLAVANAGYALYHDDGELQDNRIHPCIDYKRDSVKVIQEKLLKRNLNDPEVQSFLATIEREEKEGENDRQN